MKKNTLKRVAAAVASMAMLASGMTGICASADSSKTYSDEYKYYSTVTGLFYDNYKEAVVKSGGETYNVYDGYYLINNNVSVYQSINYPYYSSYTRKYYASYYAALVASNGYSGYVSYVGTNYASSTVYSSAHQYYSIITGKYYTTFKEAFAASGGRVEYVRKFDAPVSTSEAYSTAFPYYSKVTGRYYTTYNDALISSNNDSSNVVSNFGTGLYYSSYSGKYYSTLKEALQHSKFDASYVSRVGSSYNYFTVYVYNGKAYATLQDAINAGGTKGKDIYVTNHTYYAPSYYYDYFYNYYGTYNPYYFSYYYYYNNYLYNNNNSNNNTSSNSNTTAAEGVPHVYKQPSKHGWSYLTKLAKSATKGSVITVDMNGATVVSDAFLAEIKGRNVNVEFVYDNGVVWEINGTNVTSTDAIDLSVKYNSGNITKKLLKAACKDAITRAQITVAGDKYDSLGLSGKVNMYFDEKRAGCFAKVYMYDEEAGSLKLIKKTMVADDGAVVFTAKKSGSYLVVLL